MNAHILRRSGAFRPVVYGRGVVAAAALAALLTLSACATPTTSPAAAPSSFEAALTRHLGAITGRDIDTFLSTLTQDEALTVIFPNGGAVTTRTEVEALHREWFADPDWRMEIEPVRVVKTDSMALALVRTSYRDTPDGAPRFAYLTLTFRLEDGAWRLVHDQNTRIPAEES